MGGPSHQQKKQGQHEKKRVGCDKFNTRGAMVVRSEHGKSRAGCDTEEALLLASRTNLSTWAMGGVTRRSPDGFRCVVTSVGGWRGVGVKEVWIGLLAWM